jgi:hypothetical protein
MWMPMDEFSRLAPLALVVMLVDLLESTSIARALAAKGKYQLNANQVGIGMRLLFCWFQRCGLKTVRWGCGVCARHWQIQAVLFTFVLGGDAGRPAGEHQQCKGTGSQGQVSAERQPGGLAPACCRWSVTGFVW